MPSSVSSPTPLEAQPARPDRLWVPLICHYRASNDGVRLDPDRMAAQVESLGSDVRQFLLAGSTGDGWVMDDDMFAEVVAFSRRADLFAGASCLFGILRATTEAVVARALALEADIAANGAPAADYRGLAVCPPIDPAATPGRILDHYRRVLAVTTSDVAVYQLPQVTGCSIEPETMRILAEEPRVTMFKDTSGTDTIADAAVERVILVRGAEGGYVEALKPIGRYDGWLLSTGNAFAPALRRILALAEGGDPGRAQRISAVLTAGVQALFAAAAGLPFGNPFSNANRAADHLRAYGAGWRNAPAPLTQSGDVLPPAFLEEAADILAALGPLPRTGYLG